MSNQPSSSLANYAAQVQFIQNLKTRLSNHPIFLGLINEYGLLELMAQNSGRFSLLVSPESDLQKLDRQLLADPEWVRRFLRYHLLTNNNSGSPLPTIIKIDNILIP